MRKVFEWLDNLRFPGDWAIADMIKQFLRGRRKQITKREKIKREAEDENQAKERAERRRREAILQKRSITLEDDPDSLSTEPTNTNDNMDSEEVDEEADPKTQNWPPARPHKKRHVSPVEDSDEDLYLSE